MDINRNNYETSFLLYLDRELNHAEMLEVEKFISENSDLQKEFELLQLTVFSPEEIVYDHKELLFHKEEKRRVIPIFWIRIAASVLVLLTAGWFILTKISDNHKREIEDSNKSQVTKDALSTRKDPVNSDLSIKNNTDHKGANDITSKKFEIPGSEKGIAKKSEQSYQGREKKRTYKNNTAETNRQDLALSQTGNGSLKTATSPDETIVDMKKSNAAKDMQPEGVHTTNDPGQISALPGAKTTALVLATTATKSTTAYGKSDPNKQDFQSDNAISVVALNDQNKSITEFFKKLTKQAPDNDKSNNVRKVSVSVFQLSY